MKEINIEALLEANRIKKAPHWDYPPFVSVSVRQLKESLPPWAAWHDRHCKTLQKMMPEYVQWPERFPSTETLAFRYEEGSLFARQRFIDEGLSDFPVNLMTHALIVLYRGEMLVESPRGLNVIPEGNIALLPAGLYRFTEALSAAGALEYMILFFRPSLLLHGVVPLDRYAGLTDFITTEAPPNIYQLKAMTQLLPWEELLKLLDDLPRLMNALCINGGLGLFAFLKHHFFWQRDWIKEELEREEEPHPEHLKLLKRLHREYFGLKRKQAPSEEVPEEQSAVSE